MADRDLTQVDRNFRPSAAKGEDFAWTDARQAPPWS